MSTAPSPKKNLAVDFKSATLYAVRLVLHSADTTTLLQALEQRMLDAGAFFDNEPIVLDASLIDEEIDWPVLIDAVRAHALHPVGAVANAANEHSAQAAGLALVDLANTPARPASTPAPEHAIPAVVPVTQAAPAAGEAASEETAPPEPSQPETGYAPAGLPEPAPAAMVVNRPLRSGQRIYARNTDLIIIGVVSQGAEVIADGNIHVYGPLRGKAMAGAGGDTQARIFTTQLDPELLAIAGVYRVVEAPLDAGVRNQPCVIQLTDETLKISPLAG